MTNNQLKIILTVIYYTLTKEKDIEKATQLIEIMLSCLK